QIIIMTTTNIEQYDSNNYRASSSSVGRTEKRRSLSGKLRNLFKTSQSDVHVDNTSSSLNKKRKHPPPLPPSTTHNIDPVDAPQLQVPTVNWPFKNGNNKKDTKTKKRTKQQQQQQQQQQNTIEISYPFNAEHDKQIPQIAFSGNNSSPKIRGQNFVQSSPDLQTRILDSSNTTNIFRGYMEIDSPNTTQNKLTLPDVEVITPPIDSHYRQPRLTDYDISRSSREAAKTYSSDSSIYRTNAESQKLYSYDTTIRPVERISRVDKQSPLIRGSPMRVDTDSVKYHDISQQLASEYDGRTSTSSGGITFKRPTRSSPVLMPDVEVIPSPLTTSRASSEKRKVIKNNREPPQQIDYVRTVPNDPVYNRGYGTGTIVAEKPAQWKGVDAIVDQSRKRSNLELKSTSSPAGVYVPKLIPPKIALGRQKNEKRSKSSTTRDKKPSMTTIQNLVNRSINPSIYSSLPDAEILSSIENNHRPKYTGSKYIPDTRSQIVNGRYKGLEAIVQHHFHRALLPAPKESKPYETAVNRYDIMTTSPSPKISKITHSPQRFTTSTESLDESQYKPGIQTSPSFVQPDISVIRVGIKDLGGKSAQDIVYYTDDNIKKPKQETSYSPETYRTTKVIDVKDKHVYQYDDEDDYTRHPYTYHHQRPWDTKIRKSSDSDKSENSPRPYETDVTDDINIYRKPYVSVNIELTNGRNDIIARVPDTDYQDGRYGTIHQQYTDDAVQIKDHYSPTQPEEEDEKVYSERYEVTYEFDQDRLHRNELNRKENDDYNRPLVTDFYNKPNDNYNIYSASSNASNVLQSLDANSNVNEDKYRQHERENLSPARLNQPRHYRLKRTRSYDGLGIYISADSQTQRNHVIRDVEPTSPGDRAGLKKNDRIISVNGVPVENVDFNDVLLLIKQGLQDDNLQFSVVNTNTELSS
ncbi:unnamed protein product, partial [Didymodactylos carnosus]